MEAKQAIETLQQRGLSQEVIARMSDTTQATISRILGGVDPSGSLTVRLINLATSSVDDAA